MDQDQIYLNQTPKLPTRLLFLTLLLSSRTTSRLKFKWNYLIALFGNWEGFRHNRVSFLSYFCLRRIKIILFDRNQTPEYLNAKSELCEEISKSVWPTSVQRKEGKRKERGGRYMIVRTASTDSGRRKSRVSVRCSRSPLLPLPVCSQFNLSLLILFSFLIQKIRKVVWVAKMAKVLAPSKRSVRPLLSLIAAASIQLPCWHFQQGRYSDGVPEGGNVKVLAKDRTQGIPGRSAGALHPPQGLAIWLCYSIGKNVFEVRLRGGHARRVNGIGPWRV